MKTKNNKILKRLLIAFVIAFVAILSIPFGFGMYSSIKLHTGVTGKIEKAIDNSCQCKEVLFDLSAHGLQYSKEDGFTNQKASYVLKGSDFQGTAKEEASRINDFLKSTVAGYETLEFIELTFQFDETEETAETVKIKDGNIL